MPQIRKHYDGYELTGLSLEVVECIAKLQANDEGPPTMREIVDATSSHSTSQLSRVIKTLLFKGILSGQRFANGNLRNRTLKVVENVVYPGGVVFTLAERDEMIEAFGEHAHEEIMVHVRETIVDTNEMDELLMDARYRAEEEGALSGPPFPVHVPTYFGKGAGDRGI